MRQIFVAIFVFCIFSFPIHAEEWKSPDGLFSFTVPEGFGEFSGGPVDEIQIQHWELNNDTNYYFLTVAKSPIPLEHLHARPQAFLDGFIKGNTETVKSSFTTDLGIAPEDIKVIHTESGKNEQGFYYCDNTLSAQTPGAMLFSRGYTVFVNEIAYSLAFTSANENPVLSELINGCISSINIHATPEKPSLLGQGGLLSDEERAKHLSQGIGRMAFFCLLLALIIYLASKPFRKKKALTQEKSWEDTPFEN